MADSLRTTRLCVSYAGLTLVSKASKGQNIIPFIAQYYYDYYSDSLHWHFPVLCTHLNMYIENWRKWTMYEIHNCKKKHETNFSFSTNYLRALRYNFKLCWLGVLIKFRFDVYHEARQSSKLFSPDRFRCFWFRGAAHQWVPLC